MYITIDDGNKIIAVYDGNKLMNLEGKEIEISDLPGWYSIVLDDEAKEWLRKEFNKTGPYPDVERGQIAEYSLKKITGFYEREAEKSRQEYEKQQEERKNRNMTPQDMFFDILNASTPYEINDDGVHTFIFHLRGGTRTIEAKRVDSDKWQTLSFQRED